MPKTTAFRAALYLRLSKDDEGAEESASIATQRSILQTYAAAQGFTVVDEYADDGYSGTNFDRPAFQRMLADIERGRINCVLTKDFSRLGRNSARTSDLLDEYFPSRGVRYISVIDGYDSMHLTSGTAMAASILSVVHELYARDISNKIRSSFAAKMEQGDYIGSFAPYGYRKDPQNKNRLIVDAQAAQVVRMIFRMAAAGRSPGEIAKHLNAAGVATPALYRALAASCGRPEPPGQWTSSGICKILRNEVYLGKTLQGKTSKPSFKSRRTRAKPREDWIVAEHTHPPLISEALFQAVRSRSVSRKRPPANGFQNLFAGLAKCADCGRNMTLAPSRRKGAAYNLCCGGYKSGGAKICSNHFIDYDLLCAAVLQELRSHLRFSPAEREAIEQALAQKPAPETDRTEAALQQRARELRRLMKQLYEDFASRRISEQVFRELMDAYEHELCSLERVRQETASVGTEAQDPSALLDEMADLKTLTRPLLQLLIDRIEVEQGHYTQDADGTRHKEQTVRIDYRFRGEEST